MSPSKEVWQQIEANGKKYSKEKNKWDESEYTEGDFVCDVTTGKGQKLQGFLYPELNGDAYLIIPTTTRPIPMENIDTVSEVVAKYNRKILHLEGDTTNVAKIAEQLGLEKSNNKGEYGSITFHRYSYEGILGIVLRFTSKELRGGDLITKSQAAVGAIEDFREILSDWKFEPSSNIKI